MSHDQKPSRMKIVSAAGQQTSPGGANLESSATGQSLDVAASGQQPKGKSGLMIAILFLLGSAVGGAGLAAWPHIAG